MKEIQFFWQLDHVFEKKGSKIQYLYKQNTNIVYIDS